LGTNLIIVLPGKTETTGSAAAMFIGETPRDLTLNDAKSLTRSRAVQRVAPIAIGESTISYQGHLRDAPILGSTHELLALRHWELSRGRFLPKGEFDQQTPVAVIGQHIQEEIFPHQDPIGQWLRLGDRRYRVIGVLASEGRSIGIDVQDIVIIPAASAMLLFNSPSLFRILVETKDRESILSTVEWIGKVIKQRHQGEEDVTVITQDAVLATFDKILSALTYTVGGIAAISLAVAGILIMNVMLISVSQRTSEIGLLKALGAKKRQITQLFLTEALILSSAGAAIGVTFGIMVNTVILHFFPSLPIGAPWWAIIVTIIVAMSTGIIFGAIPARRASQLDPIQALAHK
jgi:putative ABC transport system permease protein